MVAYGEKMTAKVLYCQNDLGVKCQCQLYIKSVLYLVSFLTEGVHIFANYLPMLYGV